MPPHLIGRALGVANAAANLPGLREAKQWPAMRRLRARLHWAQFLSDDGVGTHYGVFESFDDARRWLPATPAGSTALPARAHSITRHDRPVLGLLRKAFASGTRSVLDFGGGSGAHFHAYAAHLEFPRALCWTVHDTQAMCEQASERAGPAHAGTLRFRTALDADTLDAELWFACNALQYLEHVHLGDLLETSATPPRDIVLNLLPLYAGEGFVCAQNLGNGVFAPHYVYNRDTFIAGIENAGYRLKREWADEDWGFYLPDHPERCFEHCTGLHFSRRSH